MYKITRALIGLTAIFLYLGACIAEEKIEVKQTGGEHIKIISPEFKNNECSPLWFTCPGHDINPWCE
ncbi:MAG: hypothetical protein WAW67_00785, partial [Candidatus Omnitrophota bacterium]